MSEPWDLRDANAPSEWAIDAYAVDEATPEQRAQIERHLADHPEFQAVIDARRKCFRSLPMANPQAMRARILQATETAAAPVAAPARPRRRWSLWLFSGGALAAAAAVVIFAMRPTPVDGLTPPDQIIAKSAGVALEVFRERDGKVQDLVSGDAVQAGDRLRFKAVLSAPDAKAGHVLVLGVPAKGAAFGYAPAGAKRSVAVSSLDAEGAFPGSAQLDASTGIEWAHLVWCPTAFEATSVVAEAPDRVKVPAGCRATGFKLDKR